MFNPEREVPSLELCKQLKELGFPQDGGGWYWIIYHDEDGDRVQLLLERERDKKFWQRLRNCSPNYREVIKAPTFIELWKYLPKKFKTPKDKYAYLYIKKVNNMMQIEYDTYTWDYPDYYIMSIYPSELDSICKICVWLREKGYIKFNKEVSDDNSD